MLKKLNTGLLKVLTFILYYDKKIHHIHQPDF